MNYLLKALLNKGKIVYEYNPLKNLYSNGKLSDFITLSNKDGLNFDLTHPVDIMCLPSYDGSVNLILNDDKNPPKLINTRFSALLNNTYEIVDRTGEKDTNLYNEDTFSSDTSLYKRIQKAPKINLFDVLSGGNLKVGNYVFYLKYADSDDNETDFVAESGIVSCFIGTDSNPGSVNGGYRDQNSFKMIQLKISNVDKAYDYIKVYYTRTSSDTDANIYKSGYKILLKFPINNQVSYITITGNEQIEEISLADLNLRYLVASSVKTQALCLNRLYFGNINIETPNVGDLQDASLRIIPFYKAYNSEDVIGNLNPMYKDISAKTSNKCMYYNTKNIYNYVGYWPEEIYRFGIVYIMADGTLSSVFNVLGIKDGLLKDLEQVKSISQPLYNINESDELIRNILTVNEEDYSIPLENSDKYNSKGVVNMPSEWFINNKKTLLSINFYIPDELINYLKTLYKILGWFFVRLKRIPTILAQGWTIPMDKEASVPGIFDEAEDVIKVEGFLNSKRSVTHDYKSRLHKGEIATNLCALICPEFELNQPFYNLLFTGDEFFVKPIAAISTGTFKRQSSSGRLYGIDSLVEAKSNVGLNVKIASIADSAPVVILDDCRFRAKVGDENNPIMFRYIGQEHKDNNEYKYVRGLYGPYLGVVGALELGLLYNIYIPGYALNTLNTYFKTRYEDFSEYSAISERFSIQNNSCTYECFRGDCYQCNFTHRLNRNFSDSNAPSNDIIVEADTWKNCYDIDDQVKSYKVNVGDLNAVKMGSWYTVLVWTTRNISLRALDLSYPTEEGTFGHPRTFYPLSSISAEGESKIAESFVLNAGFNTSVGERWNYTLPEAPYYKNNFLTRIAYSLISTKDLYRNGFRTFNEADYRDYSREYGGLVKLIEKSGNLFAVFEHAIALIPVNERVTAGDGVGGDLFINSNNALAENPVIISDSYGSQWLDSIIKTDRYIYGVDTVAKKIWKTDGQNGLQLISDLKVSRFLNENISLTETEHTPIIGIRNVKTHYNAFKGDVMFTFYDTTKGINEVSWNLCYDEVHDMFVTFYSWIPSFSANIDNIFFSFDRDTSKFYSRLAATRHGSLEAYGITLENVDSSKLPTVIYNSKTVFNLYVEDDYLKEYLNIKYTFKLLQDPWGFYLYLLILDNLLKFKDSIEYLLFIELAQKLNYQIYVKIQCVVEIKINDSSNYLKLGTYNNIIALRLNNIGRNGNIIYELPTTAFYRHGQAGIFDDCEKILPTYWYGQLHPFEFEVIVADNPSMHKIFNNLQIMSNKVEPESFHYEIVGEVYDWSKDKATMYYRLEATKCLLQNLGSNICYDYKYLEDFNLKNLSSSIQNLLNIKQCNKSTLFPLTYSRIDYLDKIYDDYKFVKHNEVLNSWINWDFKSGASRDYMHLSGAEIVHDQLLNEFKIWNHSKGVNLKKCGRLRGNMNYLEDMWDILINPIIFVLKNESKWPKGLPPIYIAGSLPEDVTKSSISLDSLGNITLLSESEIPNATFASEPWSARKETKIRDKYLRVRIRYSGKELALINALITKYTISYA